MFAVLNPDSITHRSVTEQELLPAGLLAVFMYLTRSHYFMLVAFIVEVHLTTNIMKLHFLVVTRCVNAVHYYVIHHAGSTEKPLTLKHYFKSLVLCITYVGAKHTSLIISNGVKHISFYRGNGRLSRCCQSIS